MTPGMSIYAYESRASQETHFQEWLLTRQEQEQRIRELKERTAMSHKRTRYGLAKRPPKIDSTDKALDQLHEAVSEGIDLARTAEEREVAMKATETVKSGRFPNAARP